MKMKIILIYNTTHWDVIYVVNFSDVRPFNVESEYS